VRSGDNGARAGEHAGEHADELEREVAGLRNRLGALITELGRRRREAFDVRLQARRHPVSTVLGTALVLGLVGLGIAAVVHRRRQARSLQGRIRALRRALASLSEPGGRHEPAISRKLVAAGGSAMASTLGRRVGKSLFGE
jgi:hypothetical protein